MNTIEQNIMEALAGNPRVNADEISVQAVDRDVILRGTVGSLVQRDEAIRTAQDVAGEMSVTDRLEVAILDSGGRADADTKAAVLDALNADAALRAADIDVAIRSGAVTLRGLVDLDSQRDRAERDALAVPGVASVRNRLQVTLPVSADEVAARVTDAVGADAIVGADSLGVTVQDGIVTLSGTVRSRDDHDTALAVAAATAGVTDVRDEMRVVG
jgi:osmotically-inducible protein OsmY